MSTPPVVVWMVPSSPAPYYLLPPASTLDGRAADVVCGDEIITSSLKEEWLSSAARVLPAAGKGRRPAPGVRPPASWLLDEQQRHDAAAFQQAPPGQQQCSSTHCRRARAGCPPDDDRGRRRAASAAWLAVQRRRIPNSSAFYSLLLLPDRSDGPCMAGRQRKEEATRPCAAERGSSR